MSKYDYLHELYQRLKAVEPNKRNEIMKSVEEKFRIAEENGVDEYTVTDEIGSPAEYAAQFITNGDIIPSEGTVVTTDNNIVDVNSNTITEQLDISTKEQTTQDEPFTEETVKPTHYESKEKTYEKVTPDRHQNQPQKKANSIGTMILLICSLGFLNLLLLGPFIAIWAIAFSFMVTGVALGISSIFVIISGLLATPFAFVSLPVAIIGHPFLITAAGFLILGIGGLLTILTIYMIRFCGKITVNYASWNIRTIRGY